MLGLGYPELVAPTRQDINHVFQVIEPIDVLYVAVVGAAGPLL